jgi:carbonic anhydrase/acetyltransferase-like protein (isoleucine patch superfamily)
MTVPKRLQVHLGKKPRTARAIWVAATATVVGDVTLGPRTSVFYGAVLRGDLARIVVREGTNLQDHVIVHLAEGGDTIIGAWCTIGHGAILHACTIEDDCLIGMGATILDRARIGTRSIVSANALVTEDFTCPPGSLVVGTPARVVRALTPAEQNDLRKSAEKYVVIARAHAKREQPRRP